MKLSQLKPDPRNANRGTKRGGELVAKSLQQFGAGRSVLVDRDGNLIAGNQTAKQAAAAGIEDDVILVQTDGTQLVVVQRTDLSIDDPKAQGLGVADNRSAELGLAWNADVLLSIDDLQPYFTPHELGKLKVLSADAFATPDQSGTLHDAYSVLVACSDEASQLALLEKLTAEGYECRSLIA
jgi:hypothetical protein